MTPKQQAFCDYYIVSGNATEAAKKAGYSEKTAYSIGQRLLKDVEIKNQIQQASQQVQKSRIATAEEILEYLSSVVRNTDEQTRERTKAAELLGKRYAIFDGERQESKGGVVSLNIQIEDCGGKHE